MTSQLPQCPRKGVNWDQRSQRWLSRVRLGGRRFFVGYYHLMEDAIDALDRAEVAADIN